VVWASWLMVPTLRVVTQRLTLRVNLDAERPERHSHAERGNDPKVWVVWASWLMVPTLRVVTQRLTLRVNLDAERPERHSHAERGNDPKVGWYGPLG